MQINLKLRVKQTFVKDASKNELVCAEKTVRELIQFRGHGWQNLEKGDNKRTVNDFEFFF